MLAPVCGSALPFPATGYFTSREQLALSTLSMGQVLSWFITTFLATCAPLVQLLRVVLASRTPQELQGALRLNNCKV